MLVQLLSWNESDIENNSESEYNNNRSNESENNHRFNKAKESGKKYTVHVFGRNEEGQSVALGLQGFCPWFHVKVPKQVAGQVHLQNIVLALQKKLWSKSDDGSWVDYRHHLVSSTIERAKSMWGFQGDHKSIFYMFRFSSLFAFKRCLNMFKYKTAEYNNLELYENVAPLLRFAHTHKLQMSGWVDVDVAKMEIGVSTSCDLEFVGEASLVVPVERDVIAPLVEMAFDIETYSFDGKFPEPTVRENAVFQIGVTVKDAQGHRKILLHCPECNPIEGVDVRTFKSEKALLLGFQELVVSTDPDFIYTYNGDKFDWNYLVERAKLLNTPRFSDLSRFRGHQCKIMAENFSSSAYGDNSYKRLEIPGRNNIDVLIVILRGNEKYSNYKLDTIAESVLGMNKKDVTPKQIFAAYASKDPEACKVVGDYCIQDTFLVQLLVDKLDVVTGLVEMSNITFIPLLWILTKGQQIKAFSQITRAAWLSGFRVPHVEPTDNESFKGAVVLEPEVGAFWKPVVVLDFASLYPTIMMAYNICYSTIVLDNAFFDLPGVKYDKIYWEEDGEPQCFTFAQDPVGVVPQLQKDLYESRLRVKRMLKDATDPLKRRVLKGREIAIKVSMNSIYGFTSAHMLQLKSLAACVTAKGREMIGQTKDFMERDFEGIAHERGWMKEMGLANRNLGLRVIGGDTDSVFVYFPECDIGQAMVLAKHAEGLLTSNVFGRDPIRMEYEKVYQPYIIQKKKNYIGKMYTSNALVHDKIDFKGIALKRRNYCNFMKGVYWKMIETIMDQGLDGVSVALRSLKTDLSKLYKFQVDIDDLVVTAQLSAKYKAENSPHISLAKKLKLRDPGSAPAPGERFGYIIIHDKKPKKPYERSEDPKYAKEHGLKPDILYYLNQQCKNPIVTFLKTLGHGAEALRVFDEIHHKCVTTLEKQSTLENFFKIL